MFVINFGAIIPVHDIAPRVLLPAANSPVVNAGDPAFAPPPATDQRGQPQVIGGRIDIGSVEIPVELFLPLIRR
jgi:hypothetical protein